MPVPRGAGIGLTQMLPHLPVTLQGTVWGLPSLVPQKPCLTGTMESLAMMIADSGGNFLAALHTEPDVAVVIADGNESLEPGSLSSPGLLLDRHDLKNLVLKGMSKEEVNDLMLLDKSQVNQPWYISKYV